MTKVLSLFIYYHCVPVCQCSLECIGVPTGIGIGAVASSETNMCRKRADRRRQTLRRKSLLLLSLFTAGGVLPKACLDELILNTKLVAVI